MWQGLGWVAAACFWRWPSDNDSGPQMSDSEAFSSWRRLYSGGRKRLPNGFWAGPEGKERAVSLLRYGLKKHLTDVLRHLRLDGASQTCFQSPADYFLAAFPRLRRDDVRDAREQITKNHSYFRRIDTEEKAYLLGLLATDGNVSGGTISLALKARDRVLLEHFEQAIGLRPSSIRPMLKGMLRTSVSSVEMAGDLARLGVVPNKTMTLRWPEGVPENLERHYLRGVFDGDGGISGRQWSIVSASESFVKRVKKRLDFVARRSLPINRAGPSKTCWVLTGGINDWGVLDWLYEGATIFLPRKKRLYEDLKPMTRLFPVEVLGRRDGKRQLRLNSAGRFTRATSGRAGAIVTKGEVFLLRCSCCRRPFEKAGSATSLTSFQFCPGCIRRGIGQREIHSQGYFSRNPGAGPEKVNGKD